MDKGNSTTANTTIPISLLAWRSHGTTHAIANLGGERDCRRPKGKRFAATDSPIATVPTTSAALALAVYLSPSLRPTLSRTSKNETELTEGNVYRKWMWVSSSTRMANAHSHQAGQLIDLQYMPSKLQCSEMPSSRPIVNKGVCRTLISLFPSSLAT